MQRIALRGWDAELVDAEDVSERDKTRYVLQDGIKGLLSPALQVLRASHAASFRHCGWRYAWAGVLIAPGRITWFICSKPVAC